MGNFRLRLDDFGFHFLRVSFHFLFAGNSHCASFFSLSLRDTFIRFRLVSLELRADIPANVHVSNINRQNFKRSTGVEPFAENGLRNFVGAFQNVRVIFGTADGGDDTFADAGDNRGFTGAADEPVDIRADGNAGFDFEFDTVFSDGGNYRRLDNFRVDAHLNCFKNVAPCQIDSGGTLERQNDLRALAGY